MPPFRQLELHSLLTKWHSAYGGATCVTTTSRANATFSRARKSLLVRVALLCHTHNFQRKPTTWERERAPSLQAIGRTRIHTKESVRLGTDQKGANYSSIPSLVAGDASLETKPAKLNVKVTLSQGHDRACDSLARMYHTGGAIGKLLRPPLDLGHDMGPRTGDCMCGWTCRSH